MNTSHKHRVYHTKTFNSLLTSNFSIHRATINVKYELTVNYSDSSLSYTRMIYSKKCQIKLRVS